MTVLRYQAAGMVGVLGLFRTLVLSGALYSVAWVGIALGAGLYIRLSHTLGADFPLNDGGLFYTMTRELQNANYALPEFTTYNFKSIPFAYPPLAFYVAGLLEDMTPAGLTTVYQYLPLALNVLSIGAFYLLARSMVGPRTAGLAVIVFAMLPRSFTWLIVGGGMTRSLAFLLAILATWMIYLFYTRREWRFLGAATILASLTLASHPEVGWFAAFTFGVFFLAYGRHRRGVMGLGLALVGMAALTSPWWGLVVSRHGWEPFMSAAGTGGHDGIRDAVTSVLRFTITEEPYISLFAVLGLLGFFVSLAKGNLVLPFWLAAILVLEPRSAKTYATIPLSMMIGLTFTELLLPGVKHMAQAIKSTADGEGMDFRARGWDKWSRQVRAYAPMGVLVVAAAFLLVYGVVAGRDANRGVLESLSMEDRRAMEWVAENIPDGSRFVVITGAPWADDQVSEWFPIVADRESVATVQGSEWLGSEEFEGYMGRYAGLQGCIMFDVGCIEGWANGNNISYSHVFLANGCCYVTLIRTIGESSNFKIIYGDGKVGIYERQRFSASSPAT
jgi:hypothetical protein